VQLFLDLSFSPFGSFLSPDPFDIFTLITVNDNRFLNSILQLKKGAGLHEPDSSGSKPEFITSIFSIDLSDCKNMIR